MKYVLVNYDDFSKRYCLHWFEGDRYQFEYLKSNLEVTRTFDNKFSFKYEGETIVGPMGELSLIFKYQPYENIYDVKAGVYEIDYFLSDVVLKLFGQTKNRATLVLIHDLYNLLLENKHEAFTHAVTAVELVKLWQNNEIFLNKDNANVFMEYCAYYFLNKENVSIKEQKELIDKYALKEGGTFAWIKEGLELNYDEECPIFEIYSEKTVGNAGTYYDYDFYSPCKDENKVYHKCVSKFGGCGRRFDGSQASFSEDHDGVRKPNEEYELLGANYHYFDHPGNDN